MSFNFFARGFFPGTVCNRALRCISILILITASVGANAQTFLPGQGAVSAGAGGAYVNLANPESIFGNQAGMGWLKNSSVGIFGKEKFFMNELRTSGGYGILHTKSGNLGVSVSHFGWAAFSQDKMGLAYARNYAGKFSVGLQLDYLTTRAENYSSLSQFTFEAGMQAKLSSRFQVGAHVFNPPAVKYGTADGERIPAVFALGIAWIPSKQLSVDVDAVKDFDQPTDLRFGFEYQPAKQIFIRAGCSTAPFEFHFGLGFNFGHIRLNIATEMHQTLGTTPSVGLNYGFGK